MSSTAPLKGAEEVVRTLIPKPAPINFERRAGNTCFATVVAEGQAMEDAELAEHERLRREGKPVPRAQSRRFCNNADGSWQWKVGAEVEGSWEREEEQLQQMQRQLQNLKQHGGVSYCAPAAAEIADTAAGKILIIDDEDEDAMLAQVTEMLKSGFDPNAVEDADHPSGAGTPPGWSVLMTAAMKGSIEMVRLLVQAGARYDYQEPAQGVSAIYLATQQGHVGVVELLLEYDPNLANLCAADGRSNIWCAAQFNQCAVLQALVDAGGDVELTTLAGVSPLWVAALDGRTEAVALLLSLGARANVCRPPPQQRRVLSDREKRARIQARVFAAQEEQKMKDAGRQLTPAQKQHLSNCG